MIWNVPAMIWATYLCIYDYEAPGVQPSRLGSKKAWDWFLGLVIPDWGVGPQISTSDGPVRAVADQYLIWSP